MSGGCKKRGPKHQNRTAFKIQFDPLSLQTHKKVSLRGLCKRCADQISWKMQYNKYKKMSEAARCKVCLQKTVLRSYMTACEPCSETLKMCPKCLDPEGEARTEVRLNQKEQKQHDTESERKMNDFMKTLKERSRRTVKRLYEKGTVSWKIELNNFVDEEGNELTLQFRHGYGDKDTENENDDDDIDEFGSEDEQNEQQHDDEEDGEEATKQKVSKKDGKEKIKASEKAVQKQAADENDSENANQNEDLNEQQWSDDEQEKQE